MLKSNAPTLLMSVFTSMINPAIFTFNAARSFPYTSLPYGMLRPRKADKTRASKASSNFSSRPTLLDQKNRIGTNCAALPRPAEGMRATAGSRLFSPDATTGTSVAIVQVAAFGCVPREPTSRSASGVRASSRSTGERRSGENADTRGSDGGGIFLPGHRAPHHGGSECSRGSGENRCLAQLKTLNFKPSTTSR